MPVRILDNRSQRDAETFDESRNCRQLKELGVVGEHHGYGVSGFAYLNFQVEPNTVADATSRSKPNPPALRKLARCV